MSDLDKAYEAMKDAVKETWTTGRGEGMDEQLMLADMTDYISGVLGRESTALVQVIWEEWNAEHSGE